ncbi:MAG: pyridoxal phosphate-dependent aminotransferase [Desulfovibrionaceae bacterium]|nr:pyridoxal phosphate-dependent aminotransferase [Desulfovibrionaceae bacterium]
MKFADRLSRFKPSGTLAVNAKTLELRARGIAVTSLAVGEPDFATPMPIKAAAGKAIDGDFSRYTAVEGIAELRQAVCGYYRRVYGVEVHPENVVLTNGGKQSLFNALMALVNPGDEVLIPSPYWTSYPDLVLLTGGTPLFVPSPSERGFRVTPDELEQARTPRTRLLILNSPANPTGVVYTEQEIGALLEWAFSHDIMVLADEIYDQLVYAPARTVSTSSWWEKYPDRLVVVNGLSKAFAMTGWRVGYTVADAALVREMSKIQGHITGNICSIAQKAAVEALTGSYECVDTMRAAFMRRRDMAYAEISSWPGVLCPRPEGAFYAFPDVSALFTDSMPDDTALCTMLLERARVAVVPGTAFGDPRCIRLSYAVADDVLMDALTRIRAALFA